LNNEVVVKVNVVGEHIYSEVVYALVFSTDVILGRIVLLALPIKNDVFSFEDKGDFEEEELVFCFNFHLVFIEGLRG